ncbi:polar growth protein, partial [Ceratobasidium sp. 423]
LLDFVRNPLSWVMEGAAHVTIVLSNNAIGFYEGRNAGNAVQAFSPKSPQYIPASHGNRHHLQEPDPIESAAFPGPACDVSARSPNEPQEAASLQGAQCPTPHRQPRRVADYPPLGGALDPTELESHAPAPPTSVPSGPLFAPAHSLAAALRSASPGIGSNASIVRSSLPVVRSASPAPQSAASLPTPITPTLTRSPAPSVLSFTSGRHIDRRSSSPYPRLQAISQSLRMVCIISTPAARVYTPPRLRRKSSRTLHPRPASTPAPPSIGLPSPATSASGTGAVPSASLSPTSARFRQASTSSDAPTPSTTMPPTVQAPFSQTPATQWTVPQVIAWLQSKGFDSEIQHAFQENDITDELGVTAFGKRMQLLKQIGELKREDEKAKEKDKLIVGSRWSGSFRPAVFLGESSRKPDITKAKQFFDQPQSQPTPTTTIKTDAKTDLSEAGSTPISSFPPSPSFKREKRDKEKEKDVKSITGSEGAISPRHAKKRSVNTSSMTGARDRLSIFGSALGKGRKPAPRYSSVGETGTVLPEERSHCSLSRLYMGSGSQRKSKVPPSPGTTSTENEARKRTISGPVGPLRSASPAGGFNIPNRSPVIPTRNLNNNPHHSAPAISSVAPDAGAGARALDRIGEPDYSGWMRKKGDRYNLSRTETKIKGYVNITGYKVIADENANPGRYGFRIMHDTAKPHFFSSEEQVVVREWMKALMKATILGNYNDPVRSSCNVPTIPLAIAQ